MEISSSDFFDRHVTFTTASEVGAICADFFREFHTTYFNYVKRYVDGSKLCLSNNAAWMKYFYTNKLYENIKIEKDALYKGLFDGKNNMQIVFWVGQHDSRVVMEQAKYFDLGNGISLSFTYADYHEFFYFGTQVVNAYMTNVYANHINVLINFIHYFKHQAKQLIALASDKKNRIQIKAVGNQPKTAKEVINMADRERKRDMDFLDPQKYYIHKGGQDIVITKREMTCIKCIMEGMVASEAGKSLGISERTIERHIENAKNKLNCRTKHELVNIILNNGLNLYPAQ